MVLCCLCCEAVPADHRRRKKFHESSCSLARQVLTKLSPTPLHLLPEISNPEAALCNKCEKKLKDIDVLETKLDGLTDSVGQLLSRLPKGTSVQLAGSKRLRPTAEELQEDPQDPPPKQVHHDHSLSVVKISDNPCGSMSQRAHRNHR